MNENNRHNRGSGQAPPIYSCCETFGSFLCWQKNTDTVQRKEKKKKKERKKEIKKKKRKQKKKRKKKKKGRRNRNTNLDATT